MGNYGVFSAYYDLLTGNVDYVERAAYFDSIIQRFGVKKERNEQILLDLGCGTGSLTEEFARLGYDTIGVDLSEEMLACAMEKKMQNASNVQYLCQDMTRLDMYGTVDITISALDSINHLSSIEAVEETFKRVRLFTNLGGLFIFDVNTPYKHRELLGNNTFSFDLKEVYCVWQNTYMQSNSSVLVQLDFFTPQSGGLYRREHEEFCEYAYSIPRLQQLLLNTGFKVIGIYDEDSFSKPLSDSQRVVYVAVASELAG